MTFQTSPSRTDSLFQAVVPTFAMSVTTSPRVDRVLAMYALVPLARFLRWQVTATAANTLFDATFRVWVAAYSYGRS